MRFVDDYAHLPTEVSAVLAAARTTTRPGESSWSSNPTGIRAPRRSGANSPMRSRRPTRRGDRVYAAGEQPVPGVTGKLIADAVVGAHPELTVRYVPERESVAEEVAGLLRPGRPVLTLGAGDLTMLPDELLGAPTW